MKKTQFQFLIPFTFMLQKDHSKLIVELYKTDFNYETDIQISYSRKATQVVKDTERL